MACHAEGGAGAEHGQSAHAGGRIHLVNVLIDAAIGWTCVRGQRAICRSTASIGSLEMRSKPPKG